MKNDQVLRSYGRYGRLSWYIGVCGINTIDIPILTSMNWDIATTAIYMYSKTVTNRAIWKYGVLWHSAISGINTQGDVNLNNIIESHATNAIYMQSQTTAIRQVQ
ncbi:MAG: hypothetical protein IJ193_07920 [Bacilli bacterium]|nr:hypothetical protein [Bacilli bacterium]